jgi:nucleoside-diphosphate-sugar epimerase
MMKVVVTGGAGYAGSILVPRLLNRGYVVKVLDLFMFGENVFDEYKMDRNLIQIKDDIRNEAAVRTAMVDTDSVIHLACISNDPSFELNPDLGKSINYDSIFNLIRYAKDFGAQRFIYASSSSVYGINDSPSITENTELKPITDYSKYKAMCEEVVLRANNSEFATCVVRPATLCGYAPRQRLDVIVNILTNTAVNTGIIKVNGGEQKRPNLHIQDMAELYMWLLELPLEMIAGEVFNVGYQNHTLMELAKIVAEGVNDENVRIETVPTNDLRSYHISSEKIKNSLGFVPKQTIQDAVIDLRMAFNSGLLPNSMTDSRYYNIKRMQEINLK